MFKTHEKSRFEVLNGKNVRDSKRIVIQICEEHLYTNQEGMAVFLCETVDPTEYNSETIEDQLKAALDELDNQRAKAEEMEKLLEYAEGSEKQFADRLNRYKAENTKMFEALKECERIFGELTKEIKQLLEGRLDNVYNGTI